MAAEERAEKDRASVAKQPSTGCSRKFTRQVVGKSSYSRQSRSITGLEAPSHYAALKPHSHEGSTISGTMTIGESYGKASPSSHILKYYKDLTVEGNVAINPQHLYDFTFLISTSANLGMVLSAVRVFIYCYQQRLPR